MLDLQRLTDNRATRAERMTPATPARTPPDEPADRAGTPGTALSVNVNKVALLRNTRHLGIPSVVRAATLALEAGAAGHHRAPAARRAPHPRARRARARRAAEAAGRRPNTTSRATRSTT
jgi:hypothetical protein